MKMVPASEFKAKCLALIDEMERSGEPLTVTRRGKPSITLTAQRPAPPPADSIFGCMKGTVTWHGDIEGPVDPDWEAKWKRNGMNVDFLCGTPKPHSDPARYSCPALVIAG